MLCSIWNGIEREMELLAFACLPSAQKQHNKYVRVDITTIYQVQFYEKILGRMRTQFYLLSCEGREITFDRSSTQVKHIKISGKVVQKRTFAIINNTKIKRKEKINKEFQ